jgi:exopolysaccharide biosynthesis polyprenyl glycosylphosphotransferase
MRAPSGENTTMNTLFGRIAAGTVARLSLLIDLVVMLLALLAASYMSGAKTLPPSLVTFSFVALATWLITAMSLRHYDPWASDRAPFDDAAMTSVLVLAVTTVLAVATTLLPIQGLPNVGLFLLILWPTAIVMRVTVFRTLSPRSGPIDEVLVVGIGPMGRATAEDLRRKGRRTVLGFARFSSEQAPEALKGKVLGTARELESVLRNVPVGEVYLAATSIAHAEEMQGAIKVCERFGVPFAMPPYLFRLERARPLTTHAIGDGYIHYQSVSSKPTQMALKRGFDILSSAFALWLLIPLLLVVTLLVKLTSRGPLLFRQVRVGLHGRPFRMLKFRTMVENAEALKAELAAHNEMDGPVFKMKRDPRITPVGRFLRKFSIDELPQLLNVLRGDMSIVGPRPPVPNEVAKYEPWQRRRLSVRPGLTCIWQVSGRNEISFEQWMYMDLQYIDNWSFLKDVSLILKTFPVVLTGRGAS